MMLTDAEALARTITELRDALLPFAEYGRLVERMPDPPPDDATPDKLPASYEAFGKLVTVGMCRKAYRIYYKEVFDRPKFDGSTGTPSEGKAGYIAPQPPGAGQ